MKFIIIGIIALTSFSSIASTEYGIDNKDLTTIQVVEDNIQKCEVKLSEARDLVILRNKVLINISKCHEVNGNVYALVTFHKYL